jgi:hypothetical protein
LTIASFFLIKVTIRCCKDFYFWYFIFDLSFDQQKPKNVVQKSLVIEPTSKTPQIDLNHFTGELIISGKSIPENPTKLYMQILNWIEEYIKHPKPTTNLRLSLEYFNTSSSIWISKIIKSLSSINDTENTLLIHLYFEIDEYENMDIEDLKDILHPFIVSIGNPTLSLGIKIYGTDDNGKVLKESMIFI